MITAMRNASGYDWASWAMGIFRSITQGGSNGVLAGLVSMGIDPQHFNITGGGLTHLLEMMGGMFLLSSAVGMFTFLQTHGAPDRVQQALQAAAAASAATSDAIRDAQVSAPPKG